MARNFHYRQRLEQVAAASASSAAAVNTSSVNMMGFETVVFVGTMATVAGNSVKLQLSEDDATWVDLPGTDLTPTANGNTWMIEVHRPLGGAYARAVVDRSGTNTALGEIWCIQHNARDMPVEQPVTMDVLFANAPDARP